MPGNNPYSEVALECRFIRTPVTRTRGCRRKPCWNSAPAPSCSAPRRTRNTPSPRNCAGMCRSRRARRPRLPRRCPARTASMRSPACSIPQRSPPAAPRAGPPRTGKRAPSHARSRPRLRAPAAPAAPQSSGLPSPLLREACAANRPADGPTEETAGACIARDTPLREGRIGDRVPRALLARVLVCRGGRARSASLVCAGVRGSADLEGLRFQPGQRRTHRAVIKPAAHRVDAGGSRRMRARGSKSSTRRHARIARLHERGDAGEVASRRIVRVPPHRRVGHRGARHHAIRTSGPRQGKRGVRGRCVAAVPSAKSYHTRLVCARSAGAAFGTSITKSSRERLQSSVATGGSSTAHASVKGRCPKCIDSSAGRQCRDTTDASGCRGCRHSIRVYGPVCGQPRRVFTVSISTSVFPSHSSVPSLRHTSKLGAHARTSRPSGTRAYSRLPKFRAYTPFIAISAAAVEAFVASALAFPCSHSRRGARAPGAGFLTGVDRYAVGLEPLGPDCVCAERLLSEIRDSSVQPRAQHEGQRLVRRVCVKRQRKVVKAGAQKHQRAQAETSSSE